MVRFQKSEYKFEKKKTCLIYSEGGRDSNFLSKLVDLPKFVYHAEKWAFSIDHWCGSSPQKIMEECNRRSLSADFDLIICFVDLDRLKNDYPKKWKEEQLKLEAKYPKISIFWQVNNAEEEYRKVLKGHELSKRRINNLATKQVERFINSGYWKKFLKIIKDKESELEKNKISQ